MKTHNQKVKEIAKEKPEVYRFATLQSYTRLETQTELNDEWVSYYLLEGILLNGKEGFILYDSNNKMLELNTDEFPEATEDTLPIWDYIEEKYNLQIESHNHDYEL